MGQRRAIVCGLALLACAAQACANDHSSRPNTQTGHPHGEDGGSSTTRDGAIPTIDAGGLSCGRQTQLATNQLIAAFDAADDSCLQASDCVGVTIGSVCTDSCYGGYLSKAGRAEVESAVSAVEHGVCAGFEDQGCQVIAAGCQAQFGTVVCLSAHCKLDQSGHASDAGTQTTDASTLTCEARTNAASAQLQQAIDHADKTCSTNADCVTAPSSTDCFAGCSTQAISKTGEAQVQEAVTTINAGVCAGFDAGGCMLIVPPCVPPPMPLCVQGQCSPVVL